MRKIFALSIIALSLSLVGCGNTQTDKSTNTTPVVEVTAETTVNEEIDTVVEEVEDIVLEEPIIETETVEIPATSEELMDNLYTGEKQLVDAETVVSNYGLDLSELDDYSVVVDQSSNLELAVFRYSDDTQKAEVKDALYKRSESFEDSYFYTTDQFGVLVTGENAEEIFAEFLKYE